MKVIKLSPTKWGPISGATYNTLVIAKTITSPLGFNKRDGTRAKLLEKLFKSRLKSNG